MLECKLDQLPITYLGIPLYWKKLNYNDWMPLINKIEKKLNSWKEKLLSIGGRLTLLKSVLSAIHLYWILLLKCHLKLGKKIEQLSRRFLQYGGSSVRKKFTLVS